LECQTRPHCRHGWEKGGGKGTGWFYRGNANLDIFWLRDESLEESDNLSDADVVAQEIVEDHEAALEQFREIASDLAGC
jgi:hypothetical protein